MNPSPNESADLAAVGALAGLFFGAWAGFVFKGNALDRS